MKKIVIDYEKCIACKACEIACAIEHHPDKSVLSLVNDKKSYSNIKVITSKNKNKIILCKQCKRALCIEACPLGAIKRDDLINSVIIDPYACEACNKCVMACPFDAIVIKETHYSSLDKKNAVKCNLCIERVKNNNDPACVDACKTKAIKYLST